MALPTITLIRIQNVFVKTVLALGQTFNAKQQGFDAATDVFGWFLQSNLTDSGPLLGPFFGTDACNNTLHSMA